MEGVRSCLAGGGFLVCLLAGGLLFWFLSEFSCSACVLVAGTLWRTLAGGDGVSLSLGAMICWCFCLVLRPSLLGGSCKVFFARVLVRRVLGPLLVWPAGCRTVTVTGQCTWRHLAYLNLPGDVRLWVTVKRETVCPSRRCHTLGAELLAILPPARPSLVCLCPASSHSLGRWRGRVPVTGRRGSCLLFLPCDTALVDVCVCEECV